MVIQNYKYGHSNDVTCAHTKALPEQCQLSLVYVPTKYASENFY